MGMPGTTPTRAERRYEDPFVHFAKDSASQSIRRGRSIDLHKNISLSHCPSVQYQE